jgi:hypothetical protein
VGDFWVENSRNLGIARGEKPTDEPQRHYLAPRVAGVRKAGVYGLFIGFRALA